MSKRKASSIEGPFVARSLAMLESPAWRALPDNARRVLERLECEHMHHGAAENGRLVCTYSDLETVGIRRKSIALAIRQCEALGFLEVTESGGRSISGLRRPSRYRLTYVHNRRAVNERRPALPTHEWRAISTDEEALAALAKATANRNPGTQAKRRKQNTGGDSAPSAGGDSAPHDCESLGAVAPLHAWGQ